MVVEQRQRAAAGLGVHEVHQRLVQQHRDAVGQPTQEPVQLIRAEILAGGVVGVADHQHARTVVHRRGQGVGVEARHRHRARAGVARHQRVQRVGRPRRDQLVALARQRDRGGVKQGGRSVARERTVMPGR